MLPKGAWGCVQVFGEWLPPLAPALALGSQRHKSMPGLRDLPVLMLTAKDGAADDVSGLDAWR
jgi:hypothetical protein